MAEKRAKQPSAANYLPIFDLLLASFAFGVGYLGRYELQILRPVFEINSAPFSPYLPYVPIYLVWLYVNFRGSGLYRNVRGRSWLEEVYIIANGTMGATVLLMALSFVFRPLVFSRLMLVYIAVVTIVLLSTLRLIYRVTAARLRAKGIGVERVLIVGAGSIGRSVLRNMIARADLGYLPVGHLDDDPERGSVDLGRVKGMGKLDNINPIIASGEIDLVVITLPWIYRDRILEMVARCQQAGIGVRVVPDAFQLNLRQVQVENLDGIPLLNVNHDVAFHRSNRVLKRAVDLLLILLASPLLLLIFALVALANRLEGAGSIFYSQRRIGENGRPFDLIKFRTMVPDADRLREQLVKESGQDPRHPKIKDDPRVTKLGRLLRATSLDELPNIINVLRGQMSLVGPRPPTPDEVALYEPWHMQRLQIMPGITGLWQVSGRSDVPFEEMCLLDIYYIENWSVRMDAQILMMTIPRVLLGSGAY